ncbi:MAG: sensor histidine kinase, partial [Sulfurospirillum sp.]|nr:sensor histidine kinase [Sulfurospirillum sp.]
LREIHHRVANNMQVIVSLLRMHSRMTDDTHLGDVFDDCRNRVNAMSLIHEALYQSKNLARIDFKIYLKKLCNNMTQAYGTAGKGIVVTVNPCEVDLGMDQGITVGMIVCELASNAFKHAFQPGKPGQLLISLSSLEGNMVELIVQDNGKSLPPEIDILNPPSLGLRLTVAAVTRELGGSIDVERNCGTRFIICFKCKKKD